ncbi:MAG: hypothetical protein AAFZ07_25695 [Actinomycetota bacterium]
MIPPPITELDVQTAANRIAQQLCRDRTLLEATLAGLDGYEIDWHDPTHHRFVLNAQAAALRAEAYSSTGPR